MKFKIFFKSLQNFNTFFLSFLLLIKKKKIINHNNQFTTVLSCFSPLQKHLQSVAIYTKTCWLNSAKTNTKKNWTASLPSRLLSALNLQSKFLNLRFEPRPKQSAPLPSHVSISCFSESVGKFYCSHEEKKITRQVQRDDHSSDTWPISLS